MHIHRNIRPFYACLVFALTYFSFSICAREATLQYTPVKAKHDLALANSLLNSNPDSSYVLYERLLPYYKRMNDTINIVLCHIGYSDIYKTRAQYSNSYDHIWDALLLAEELNARRILTKIHMELGSLYNIYDKNDEALHHIKKALNIARKLENGDQFQSNILSTIYYALAVYYRKNEQFSNALSYLDSCMLSKRPPKAIDQNLPYIDAEKGFIFLQLNRLDSAEFYLNRSNEIFTKEGRSYQVVVNSFLGALYIEKDEIDKAIKAYRKSLEVMGRCNTHVDMRSQVLLKLSEAYEKNNNTPLAYFHLKRAHSITDSVFNAKSDNNRKLFQIKNKYREAVKERDEYIKQQNIVIERKNLIQSRLKIAIAFILFAVIGVSIIVRMRFRLRKFGMEKNQLKLQAQHVKEKAKSVMEVKSRELTASTLQMIEKDRIVSELMLLLKKGSPSEHKSMKLKINKGSRDMWEQFNKRFTEVNSHFYDNLRDKHPDLTPTEQKHCALIKLSFDSKEMASLLNISVNSVHISRHRIRKKMGLDREDNLSNYIADF